jgi:hypothetical protein
MRLITGILCTLLALGYFLAAGFYPAAGWIQAFPMRILWPLLGLAAALAFQLLLPPTARRRDPALAGWGAFGLLGCLLVVPLIFAREQQARLDAAETARLVSMREELKLEQRRREQARRAEEADRQERARTDRFVQYEGRIPARDLDALRLLDARMRGEVEAIAGKYAEALKRHPTKGPGDWIRSRTLKQLDAERAAHQALYQQTRAFAEFTESFEQRYSSAIEKLGLRPPADRVAIAEMERILQAWDQSRLLTLRQLDVQALATALRALDILRKEWGNWSFDPRTDQLVFQQPGPEAAFHQALHDLQLISEEVSSITAASGPES